jgi:hypothetical protein
VTLVEKSSRFLERHLSRRSFLVRGTFAASALAVTPKRYVLQSGTAYEAFCGEAQCGSSNCSCGSTCCQGYSTFCCTINGGQNFCPEGSVIGGWWAAADSSFCGNGTRYYLDCNARCHCDAGCGSYYSNGGTFCEPGCDGLTCRCEADNCDNWVEGCFQFRYGQCNTDVGCTGRIICRIVSCVEPWKLGVDCGTSYIWDSGTAEMNAPCNTAVPCDSSSTKCETVAIASPPKGGGYWLVTSYGKVLHFGGAKGHGDLVGRRLAAPIVTMQSTATGLGYWLVSANGSVFAFGDAKHYGPAKGTTLPDTITAMAPTPGGDGYWLVGRHGQVYGYGGAKDYGSLVGTRPKPLVTGIDSTVTGRGYWLVGESGRVHAFGDAVLHGSPEARHPVYPVIGIRRSYRGSGYFVYGARGAVWAYGDAVDAGSPYGHLGYWDTVGLARGATEGYWVTTADGAVYNYGGASRYGSAN